MDREKRQVKKRLSCLSTSAAGEEGKKKKVFPRMHKTSDEQALCNVVSTQTGTPPSETHIHEKRVDQNLQNERQDESGGGRE